MYIQYTTNLLGQENVSNDVDEVSLIVHNGKL